MRQPPAATPALISATFPFTSDLKKKFEALAKANAYANSNPARGDYVDPETVPTVVAWVIGKYRGDDALRAEVQNELSGKASAEDIKDGNKGPEAFTKRESMTLELPATWVRRFELLARAKNRLNAASDNVHKRRGTHWNARWMMHYALGIYQPRMSQLDYLYLFASQVAGPEPDAKSQAAAQAFSDRFKLSGSILDPKQFGIPFSRPADTTAA